MKNTDKEFLEIVQNLTKLRNKKNKDYGNGFIMAYSKYGEKALFFDLLRKWQRIEHILYNNNKTVVDDETIEDTLGDLAVMSINGIIWMRNRKWSKNG